LYKNAITLGDLDNDEYKDNELAVGTIDGELMIFKGDQKKPWRVCSGLGSITCMAVGDVRNVHKSSLVVIASEGTCYVFDFGQQTVNADKSVSKDTSTTHHHKSGSTPEGTSIPITQSNVNHLTAPPSVVNASSAPTSLNPLPILEALPPIDSMNSKKFDKLLQGQESKPAKGSEPVTAENSAQNSPHDHVTVPKSEAITTVEPERIEPSFYHRIACNANCVIIADIDEDGKQELIVGSNDRAVYSYALVESGKHQTLCLKLKNKWNLMGQVHSLSISCDKWGRPVLLVGQNGGVYCQIDHRGQLRFRSFGNSKGEISIDDTGSTTEVQRLKRSSLSRAGTVQSPILQAMATLDGVIKLQDLDDKLLWELQVEHQLFSLHILDINGEDDLIVVTSWDGMTYIIDQYQNFVRFKLEDRVCLFIAGHYALSPGQNKPCLIYVTFNDQIIVFNNLKSLEKIPALSLLGIMKDEFEKINSFKPNPNTDWSRQEQVDLIKYLIKDDVLNTKHCKKYLEELEEKAKHLKGGQQPK
jgi:hypothetical protein